MRKQILLNTAALGLIIHDRALGVGVADQAKENERLHAYVHFSQNGSPNRCLTGFISEATLLSGQCPDWAPAEQSLRWSAVRSPVRKTILLRLGLLLFLLDF